jgi:hypothetical protein
MKRLIIVVPLVFLCCFAVSCQENGLANRVDVLEDQVKTMENRTKALQVLLDIEQIKTLQRVYGFYLEHWMYQEIVDCFSDSPEVQADFYPIGIWKGKEGIKRYFGHHGTYDPEFLHQIIQLSPVIHVDPDGTRAKGRWAGYGPIASPQGGGVNETLHSGTYEMEYIKEDGIWKFLKLSWRVSFIGTPGKGFVPPERAAAVDPDAKPPTNPPDVATPGNSPRYPSGYIYPFHYPHPVTGRKTSEDEINAQLKYKIGE